MLDFAALSSAKFFFRSSTVLSPGFKILMRLDNKNIFA